ENFCAKQEIPVIGKLPYNDIVTKAMLQEQTLIEYTKGSEYLKENEFSDQVCQIWARVEKILMGIQDKQERIKTLKMKNL
ncbi:MAG TPA: (4Fe-4S)-binding protein, partial [Methanosarcina vacuolata]|nr:(4Fe-4S)-binding protein [Methanosarcina vacuolata]